MIGRAAVDPWLLAGLGGLMLVALIRRLWQWREERERATRDPFLVFPSGPVAARPIPVGPPIRPWVPPVVERPEPAPQAAPAPAPVVAPPPAPAPAPIPKTSAAPAPVSVPSRAESPRPQSDVDEASETIRIPTAADGRVEILPGALEVVRGPEPGREFRFLRLAGQEVPEVTVGRSLGSPYLHVQLAAPTVSRMHARLRYQDRQWRIANLSATNPLRLNGLEIRAAEESLLADGDRILLGEVELCFHDRRS